MSANISLLSIMGAFQNQGLQSGHSYTQDEILRVLDKSVFHDIYQQSVDLNLIETLGNN